MKNLFIRGAFSLVMGLVGAFIAISYGVARVDSKPSEKKSEPKRDHYCVHNGYASWQPRCETIETRSSGLVTLFHCSQVGVKEKFMVFNPTNVTECE